MINDITSKDEKIQIAKLLKPITPDMALKDFLKLKSIDLDKISPLCLFGNKTVDYFTFVERLETKNKKNVSYFELLENTDKYLQTPSMNRVNITMRRLRPYYNEYQIWYNLYKLYFATVTIFKPLNAMKIYKKYKPNTVLDFSMGWGGRLVGCCALDIPKYIGIDINYNLREPYYKMIDFIKPYSNTEIVLYFKDAVTIDYSKLWYDMVFTSPPYHNTEIYPNNQQFTKQDWNEKFYNPIFENTYKYLQKGGHFCINISPLIYLHILIPLLGEADECIPLPKVRRHKNRSFDENYKEFIYVWTKK